MSGESPLPEQAIADLRHDLRTPLNHIIGYGEMLMEDAEERGDAASLDALRGIHATAKELVAVIQNTLSPTRDHVSEAELAAMRDSLEEPLRGIIAGVGRLLETGDHAAASDLERIRSAAERLLAFQSDAAPVPPEAPAGDSAPEPLRRGPRHGRLLVVDDNAPNRDLLSRRLEREGYTVVQAAGGNQALEAARKGEIELVLLDIMMPEMDGYQVLEIMKSDPQMRDIPVIMISALDEIRSVVRCIEMGAEDYLPKPFDPVLLRARVGACLEKKWLRDEERRKTEELERTLQRLRQTQDQLVIQEKMASLGAMTAGIAHEIKNPLNFVTNFSEVALDLTREIRTELPPEQTAGIGDILDTLDQSMAKIREHGLRADSIVRAMLLHARGQSSGKQRADINQLLAQDLNLAYHGLRAHDSSFNCAIRTDFDPSLGEVSVIPQQLSRVFLNIVNNGCYAVHQKSKKGGNSYVPTITVSSRNAGDHIEIRIRDNGDGIPKDLLAKVFDPFFSTKPAGAGTGLGLSISYEIVVQRHHGELKVESVAGEFTEFLIRLPRETGSEERKS